MNMMIDAMYRGPILAHADMVGLVVTYIIFLIIIANVAVYARNSFKRKANIKLLSLEWTQEEYTQKHKHNKWSIFWLIVVALVTIGVLYIPLEAYNPMGRLLEISLG